MERLTEKHFAEKGYYLKCSEMCEEMNCSFCEHGSDALDKLGEYEDAEEHGLLVRLPCKVGDTVYVVENGDITEEDIVHEMNYGRTSSGDLKMLFLCEMGVAFYGEEVGKTIFLTREEVDAALADERAKTRHQDCPLVEVQDECDGNSCPIAYSADEFFSAERSDGR